MADLKCDRPIVEQSRSLTRGAICSNSTTTVTRPILALGTELLPPDLLSNDLATHHDRGHLYQMRRPWRQCSNKACECHLWERRANLCYIVSAAWLPRLTFSLRCGAVIDIVWAQFMRFCSLSISCYGLSLKLPTVKNTASNSTNTFRWHATHRGRNLRVLD